RSRRGRATSRDRRPGPLPLGVRDHEHERGPRRGRPVDRRERSAAATPARVSDAGRFDAIVVGVGTMGSAALYHLARRGSRVLGLEQFGVAHDRGSMHGETRIIRLAYHEQPDYVPLLRRAYELWRELDETLLHIVGSLDVGP